MENLVSNVIEHLNQRVLTNEQLAEIYVCTSTHIKQNFNNHKVIFLQDKHYYLLKGDELSCFKKQVDNISLVPKKLL